MNTYRVNINDLFDQDEDFLFENEHFKALIRKTKRDFEYLINPAFDLDDVIGRENPLIDKLYEKPKEGYNLMN